MATARRLALCGTGRLRAVVVKRGPLGAACVTATGIAARCRGPGHRGRRSDRRGRRACGRIPRARRAQLERDDDADLRRRRSPRGCAAPRTRSSSSEPLGCAGPAPYDRGRMAYAAARPRDPDRPQPRARARARHRGRRDGRRAAHGAQPEGGGGPGGRRTRCAGASGSSTWTASWSSARARRTRRRCSTSASRSATATRPAVDVAVDPIDGTRLVARGHPGRHRDRRARRARLDVPHAHRTTWRS